MLFSLPKTSDDRHGSTTIGSLFQKLPVKRRRIYQLLPSPCPDRNRRRQGVSSFREGSRGSVWRTVAVRSAGILCPEDSRALDESELNCIRGIIQTERDRHNPKGAKLVIDRALNLGLLGNGLLQLNVDDLIEFHQVVQYV